MKEMIDCHIPIKFPIKPNINGICFAKESLKDIKENLRDAPIFQNENVIGKLSDSFDAIENNDEIILIVDSKLFRESYSEISFFRESYSKISILEREDNTIKKFRFMGINL